MSWTVGNTNQLQRSFMFPPEEGWGKWCCGMAISVCSFQIYGLIFSLLRLSCHLPHLDQKHLQLYLGNWFGKGESKSKRFSFDCIFVLFCCWSNYTHKYLWKKKIGFAFKAIDVWLEVIHESRSSWKERQNWGPDGSFLWPAEPRWPPWAFIVPRETDKRISWLGQVNTPNLPHLIHSVFWSLIKLPLLAHLLSVLALSMTSFGSKCWPSWMSINLTLQRV